MPNPDTQHDFFAGTDPVPANRTLEIDIATASRVGLDGVSVIDASVDEGGELLLILSNGVSLNAGRVTGAPGLTGIAHLDTIPLISGDPQLYIASGKGTYGHFRNRWNQPIQIEKENTIVFLFCPAGSGVWEYAEMELNLNDYRKRSELTFLSTEGPVFSCYPPAVEAVEGLYDPATGEFHLPEGANTVTSQTEVFGHIVYTGCSHIMVGFNLEYAIYLETATGRCLAMDVFTKETHYDAEPFAAQGISKRYVRVNTGNEASPVIEIEESDDGFHYTPYAQINRGARPGLYITYRTIGFYQPGAENTARILSVGRADRLMLDRVAVADEPESGTYEVLCPSDNYAGVVRRKVSRGGKLFTGRRIVLYGDSITGGYGVEPGTYADFVRRKFDSDDVTTFGYNESLGSKTTNKSDSLTDDQQIGAVTSLEPDLLIFMAGTGDYWGDLPLGDYYGDIENAAYVRTTTGGLRYLLHHFTKNLPTDCRVLFCTPTPGTYNGRSDMEANGAGHKMDEYVQRLRAICAEYHVPVCDAWANAGWPTYHEARVPRFTTDGVHLSAKGYDRLTSLLLSEASRYC